MNSNTDLGRGLQGPVRDLGQWSGEPSKRDRRTADSASLRQERLESSPRSSTPSAALALQPSGLVRGSKRQTLRTIAGECTTQPDQIRPNLDRLGRARLMMRSRFARLPDRPAPSGSPSSSRRATRARRPLHIGSTARIHRLHFGDQRGTLLDQSLVPAARGSSGEPGTRTPSRPCSGRILAVISEPNGARPLVRRTPSDSPEKQAVAPRKNPALAVHCPSGISEIAAPLESRIAAIRSSCSRSERCGRGRRHHRDGASSRACAMRRLIDAAPRPDMMTRPASPEIAATRSRNFIQSAPRRRALREPTIAIHRPHQGFGSRRSRASTAARRPGLPAATGE